MTDITKNSLPLPVRLIQQHSISVAMIARAADLSHGTVSAALDPARVGAVKHDNVATVRCKVEEILAFFNHQFPDDELWAEYGRSRVKDKVAA